MTLKVIYVAGPLTNGDSWANVNRAIRVGEAVRRAGYVPLIPHLSILHALLFPGVGYEDWMKQCLEYVSRSDIVLRMPGASKGADREVEFALSVGIPVVELSADADDFAAWTEADMCARVSQMLRAAVMAISMVREDAPKYNA